MSELKPCPFCGGEAITTAFFDADDFDYMPIEVNDCDAEVTCKNERCINGWWLSPKDWNTRPIEDALNARIAELEAAQRWIPVGERLPEVGEMVLIAYKISRKTYIARARMNKEGQFRFAKNTKPVTHWMPLPQPPEVEK